METMNPVMVDQLHGGELVRVRLHGGPSGDTDLVTRFVGFATEGGLRRARFQEDGASFVWNARSTGAQAKHWLYGVNESEYLTIEAVLETGSSTYVFDKHLVKLAARRRPQPGEPDHQPENPQYRRHRRGRSRTANRFE